MDRCSRDRPNETLLDHEDASLTRPHFPIVHDESGSVEIMVTTRVRETGADESGATIEVVKAPVIP